MLMKNGLGFLFVKTAITRNPQKELNRPPREPGMPTVAERIRISCEQLGPTFVKLGQMLSTRTDIVPEGVALELQKLQDDVLPFSFEQARDLIETELQDKVEDIFPDFCCEPAASASVSQVYRAHLRNGDLVAVKVQRPGVLPLIETDLHILLRLARFVDKHTKYGKLYDFEGMVTELRRVMDQEMDFVHEAENIDRFRANLEGNSNVGAPKVRWIYTTSKVLTMDYVDGIKINDIETLDRIGADRKRIARIFTDSLLKQILVDGFFHADPHPGNVMVTENGKKVEFIDLGMAGRLGERFRQQLTDMIMGIATQNVRKVAQSIMDMDAANANVNQRQFIKTLNTLMDEYLYESLGRVNIAQLFGSVFTLAGEYKMKIPREFTLVAKALGTVQNIIDELDPDTNIIGIAEHTVRGMTPGVFTSKEFKHAVTAEATDVLDIIKTLPAYILSFMRKTEENDFALELRIKYLEQLERGLERMANRISFTVVLLAVCMVMAGVIVALGYQAGRGDEALYEISMFALRMGLIIGVVIVGGIVVNIIYTNMKKP